MVMASLAGSAVLGFVPALGAPDSKTDEEGLPKANIVEGKPPMLDYGDGVLIPCDKRAFLTLWESPTFWLTFGFGTAGLQTLAKSEALHHAEGAMRFLLLTLAFAPKRLEQVPGHGWHQKVEAPGSYVVGKLDLPGRPSKAMSDFFMARGNMDASRIFGRENVGGVGATASIGQSGAGPVGDAGMLPSMAANNFNAFCTYFVMKKDLSLDDVRARATDIQG